VTARMPVSSHWRETNSNFLGLACDWQLLKEASTALSLIGPSGVALALLCMGSA